MVSLDTWPYDVCSCIMVPHTGSCEVCPCIIVRHKNAVKYAFASSSDTAGCDVRKYVVTQRLQFLVPGWSRFSLRSLGSSTLRPGLWRLSKQRRLRLLRLMSELSPMVPPYSALVHTELKVTSSKYYPVIRVNVTSFHIHKSKRLPSLSSFNFNYLALHSLWVQFYITHLIVYLFTTVRCVAFTHYICKYYVLFLPFE
jgi:hypothetical protein